MDKSVEESFSETTQITRGEASRCGYLRGEKIWSGKRDSNSRPRPWQGRALPTELFPRLLVAKQRGVFYGFILLCQIKFVKKFFDWLKIIQK